MRDLEQVAAREAKRDTAASAAEVAESCVEDIENIENSENEDSESSSSSSYDGDLSDQDTLLLGEESVAINKATQV